MFLILLAFFLETRGKLHSKAKPYLSLMAIGSALLAIRAYLIEEWAFLILELAWFSAAFLGILVGETSKSPLMPETADLEIEVESILDQ
jgi:NhaP-type Na+/H+ and K+/H+ antiporter